MANAAFFHAFRAIERAERPLLVIPPDADVDTAASALALQQAFAQRGKTLAFFAPSGLPEALTFLAGTPPLTDLPHLRTLTISLSTDRAKMDELSYAVVGNEVRIHVITMS
jgi:hypothetical protein